MAQPRPCPRPPRPRPQRGLRAASHRRRCQGSGVHVRVHPRPFVSLSGSWSCSPITPRAQPLQPFAPPQSTRISDLESILVGDGASPPRGRPRSVRTAAHALVPPRYIPGEGLWSDRCGPARTSSPSLKLLLDFRFRQPLMECGYLFGSLASAPARARPPARARTLSLSLQKFDRYLSTPRCTDAKSDEMKRKPIAGLEVGER